MRALIYCRVSDDRAEGRSPREQEADSRIVCEREGWTVSEVITDSVGASRYSRGKRPGWVRAVELIESGAVDVLVTWENSRANRDLRDFAALRDLCARQGVLWSYSGRTHDLNNADDRFTTGLDALLAEKETGQISGRVKRATRANAAAGRPHGRLLYGYRRVYDQATGKLDNLEPDPAATVVVRRIYDASESGQGMDSIARDLNAESIPNPSGRQWTGLAVKRVLTNPGYAGRRVHLGEVVGSASWPAIIDSDRFDRLQTMIEARRVDRTPNRAWLLTGVTRCGVCNGKVGVKRSGEKPKYVCMDRFCVARSTEALHAFVANAIVARIESADVSSVGPAPTAEVAEIQASIAELEARMDAAAEEVAKGKLSVRALVRVERIVDADLAALRSRLRRLAVPQHLALPTGDVRGWWDTQTPERQRVYASALIDVVVIHKTQRGQRTFDPSKVEIVWR